MGTMKILWWHFGNIWYDDLPISTNPAKTLFGIVHMRHIRFWTNWAWTNDMALGRKHHISWSAHWGAYVRWNTMAARWNISTPKSWTRTVFVSSDVWFMARTFLGILGYRLLILQCDGKSMKITIFDVPINHQEFWVATFVYLTALTGFVGDNLA